MLLELKPSQEHKTAPADTDFTYASLVSLPAMDEALAKLQPWKKDPYYFQKVHILALALMKMTSHAQGGGNIEVMGMITGKYTANRIVVMDAYALPVEGTETRVNAQAEGYEYMVAYMELKKRLREENIVGWYHSHPGYGCWLSGIDVSTQLLNQNFQDPYLALVIDPILTSKQGKVEIGAFRTLPEGSGEVGEATVNSGNTILGQLVALSRAKRLDYGAHSDKYYKLDVEIFHGAGEASILAASLRNELASANWIRPLMETGVRETAARSGDSLMAETTYLAIPKRKQSLWQEKELLDAHLANIHRMVKQVAAATAVQPTTAVYPMGMHAYQAGFAEIVLRGMRRDLEDGKRGGDGKRGVVEVGKRGAVEVGKRGVVGDGRKGEDARREEDVKKGESRKQILAGKEKGEGEDGDSDFMESASMAEEEEEDEGGEGDSDENDETLEMDEEYTRHVEGVGASKKAKHYAETRPWGITRLKVLGGEVSAEKFGEGWRKGERGLGMRRRQRMGERTWHAESSGSERGRGMVSGRSSQLARLCRAISDAEEKRVRTREARASVFASPSGTLKT